MTTELPYILHFDPKWKDQRRRRILFRPKTVSWDYWVPFKTCQARTEMVGMTFGRLEVIDEWPERNCGKIQWLCVCECGSLCTKVGKRLRSGEVTSCGCYKREIAAMLMSKTATEYHRRRAIKPAKPADPMEFFFGQAKLLEE